MLFLDVLRFLGYAGPDAPSRSNADARVAFPFRKQDRHPERDLSKLNSPARRCLCLRFERRLATPSAGLEVKVVRYSFLVGLFHSQQHAGLSRRSREKNLSVVPLATWQEERGQTRGLSQAVQRFEGSRNEL